MQIVIVVDISVDITKNKYYIVNVSTKDCMFRMKYKTNGMMDILEKISLKVYNVSLKCITILSRKKSPNKKKVNFKIFTEKYFFMVFFVFLYFYYFLSIFFNIILCIQFAFVDLARQHTDVFELMVSLLSTASICKIC